MKIYPLMVVCSITITFLFACAPKQNNSGITPNWSLGEEILKNINEPVFKDTAFNIMDFGAQRNGALCTGAINKTIATCSNSGGGIVIVPEGIFNTGPVYLKSNVRLHLEAGAELRFSVDPVDYLPVVQTRWEGMNCFNYSPLVYSFNEQNIAITGKGTLNGMANETNWWPWKGRKEYGWEKGMESQLDSLGRPLLLYYEESQANINKRIFGEKGYLRPQFVNFVNCKNILIEGVSILNAPFWLLHPLFSENITIRGVTLESHGPNNDGCDPESCRNVLIEDCFFNTGDDCIAIKSGRNNDGRNDGIPSENILIRNCTMKNGHGGVVLGSEVSGGCNNIFVENCKMNSPELERALRIKTNSLRGGIIENLYFRNIEVVQVSEAVVKINTIYEMEGLPEGEHFPLIRNIFISGISSSKSDFALFLLGNADNIKNIYIENSTFNGVEKNNTITGVTNLDFDNVKINGIPAH